MLMSVIFFFTLSAVLQCSVDYSTCLCLCLCFLRNNANPLGGVGEYDDKRAVDEKKRLYRLELEQQVIPNMSFINQFNHNSFPATVSTLQLIDMVWCVIF